MDITEMMLYKTRKAAQDAADVRNERHPNGFRFHSVVVAPEGFIMQRVRQSGRVEQLLRSNIWMKVES